jgi:hypothetical protein
MLRLSNYYEIDIDKATQTESPLSGSVLPIGNEFIVCHIIFAK